MNKEDLQQISALMQEQLAPLKSDIASMKGDISSMKGDISTLQGAVSSVQGDIATLKDDTRQTRVLIEQQQHSIQLIAEQYGDIAEKLDKANERAAQMDDFSTRLRAVEMAVMRHNAILQGLQKAE